MAAREDADRNVREAAKEALARLGAVKSNQGGKIKKAKTVGFCTRLT